MLTIDTKDACKRGTGVIIAFPFRLNLVVRSGG